MCSILLDFTYFISTLHTQVQGWRASSHLRQRAKGLAGTHAFAEIHYCVLHFATAHCMAAQSLGSNTLIVYVGVHAREGLFYVGAWGKSHTSSMALRTFTHLQHTRTLALRTSVHDMDTDSDRFQRTLLHSGGSSGLNLLPIGTSNPAFSQTSAHRDPSRGSETYILCRSNVVEVAGTLLLPVGTTRGWSMTAT